MRCPSFSSWTALAVSPPSATSTWLPSIVAVAEGTPQGRPRRRLVWEWSVAKKQRQLWKILFFTTTAVPLDELKRIVYAVRDSLQAR